MAFRLMQSWLGGSSIAAVLGALVCTSACGDAFSHCTSSELCGPEGGSGADQGGTGGTSDNDQTGATGAGGIGAALSECTGDVADDPSCWTTNQLGVFVSSDTGDDVAGDGTREHPYASITKGIAEHAGRNVYVCRGEAAFYEESLAIDASADGVRIYGGFDCEQWSYAQDRFAAVRAPHVALRIEGVGEGVTIENLRLVTEDAVEPGASTYGAFVIDSERVVLRRVRIEAGAGAAGAPGQDGAKGDDAPAPGGAQNGKSVQCTGGKPGGSWPEPYCGSLGGHGSESTLSTGKVAADGSPTQNVYPESVSNKGLSNTVLGAPGGNGGPGSPGNLGPVGEAAPGMGQFTERGYLPADGLSGTQGFPGQGGGGGGASWGHGAEGCEGASGGAGGMGGCGGDGGGPGAGGGASIGLLSARSFVSLDACDISSGAGGAGAPGGKGGVGGAGGKGGLGGQGLNIPKIGGGGIGGFGGAGGDGGAGSGGSGGPSLAIAYQGTQPEYDESTALTPGTGGEPGVGAQTLELKAPDGSAGMSEKILAVP